MLARIARATAGVAHVGLVARRKRLPDGTRSEVRAPDALDPSLQALLGGYTDRITSRVTTDTGRLVDAFLQVPHRVEIADSEFEDPVRLAMGGLGAFSPGALPDDSWSLAPHEHGQWRYDDVLPRGGFERLVASKLLARVKSSHVSSREFRMHGTAYVVRSVPGFPGMEYALAEDPSLGARIVRPEDRVAWRLDTALLAARMMRDLGAQPVPAPLAVAGILDLGVVMLPSGALRIFYLIAEPPAGWVDAVRRACGLGVTPVILLPNGRAGEANGMLEVELDIGEQLGATRVGRVLGRIAEAIGVGHEVDMWRRCSEDVVVDSPTQRVWVTGVLVPYREREYWLMEELAHRGGRWVATKDLGELISDAGAADVTARKAKAEVEKQTRAALRREGVDTEIVDRMIGVDTRKGYRLGVSARVV
jgi:hypothetical protein